MSEWAFSYTSRDYTLAFCRDGMIMLRIDALQVQGDEYVFGDAEKRAALWEQYLQYVNCLCLLIDSHSISLMRIVPGYLDLRAITRHDTLMLIYEGGKEVAFSFMRYTTIPMSSPFFERVPGYYPLGFVDEFNFRNATRLAFPQEVFDVVHRDFSIIAADPGIRDRLSNITKSIGEHKDGNYRLSLVVAWFVIESILREKWNNLLDSKNVLYDDGTKRIPKDRRKAFIKGQDYTISVVTNILELSDNLPIGTFREIDSVRDHRNAVVHQRPGYTCTSEHSKQAITVALRLATEGSSLDLQPNLSFPLFGP